MSNDTFDELTADIKYAVIGKGTRVSEALDWQISHSREQDLAVIQCFKQNFVRWGKSLSGRQRLQGVSALLHELCKSPNLNFFDLLDLYRWQVTQSWTWLFDNAFETVYFGLSYYGKKENTDVPVFLAQFKALSRKEQLDVIASLLAEGGWKYSIAICSLAQCIDWGVLRRLTPSPFTLYQLKELQDKSRFERGYDDLAKSQVDDWDNLLETLVEVEGFNLNTELFK